MHIIAGTVGLNDAHLVRYDGGICERFPADPVCENLPFRIVLGIPVLATIVTRIATCRDRQRMQQQAACCWISWNDFYANRIIVLSRFFVSPCGVAGSYGLQTHRRPHRVAGHTARMAWPLGRKDWLNACF